LRAGSLAALGLVVACKSGSPNGEATPSPTTSGSGSPSPTATAPTRAFAWRRIGVKGPPARSHHTLTANADGSILFLFGGRTKGRIFRDAWAYDRGSHLWQPLPYGPAERHSPTARYGHSAAFVEGHLVIFGGQAGGKFLNDAWAFDSVRGEWIELKTGSKNPGARAGAGGTTIASALVVSHGVTARARVQDTWALSTKWTNVTPKGARPAPRSDHRIAYMSGRKRMLLFGGRSNKSLLGDTWLYDPTVLAWTQLKIAGPSARSTFAAVGTANNAYVFGGEGARGALSDLWSFDGSAWRSHRVRGGPRPRGGIEGAVVAGPAMYVFGGTDGVRTFDDLYELALPA
jgi:Kelch motif protein/galactose oxidase-like protein